eukprot:gnl/TRDRNA2_/TRDRNA2_176366_c0_seq1.p1 gnl/TRDRNA2_/TRDRNA2_176366_c0~~gnl/TRDRNA2_/TRDRNA2_176366_c0_seq1.p1  ORF type:complete len:374 (+),score=38.66 gnl/TRDRNA2_/TRDRNA2_176366_c0_seq1:85-1206(+)
MKLVFLFFSCLATASHSTYSNDHEVNDEVGLLRVQVADVLQVKGSPNEWEAHGYPMDWAADMAQFRNYMQVVGPHPGRCNCRRVDSRTLLTKTHVEPILNFTTPIILTHVLDGTAPDTLQAWTRAALLRKYGHINLSRVSLNTNGAGHYITHMLDGRKNNKTINNSSSPAAVGSITLAESLDMDQPGNLFLDALGALGISKHDVSNSVLGHNGRLIEAAVGSKNNFDISLGVRGQWNQVHQHGTALFFQIKGSKGWVVAPPDTFPAAKQLMISRLKAKGPYGSKSQFLIELGQMDVCAPFQANGNMSSHVHLETARAAPASAAHNLTQHGSCCTVRAGEAFLVPGNTRDKGWWHGTCNLEDWNAGIAFIRSRV